ncbi:hypothetical protein KC19_VG043200 [Ceratodon purpureus]|uniref:DUF4218 domain-containing protein n=1 Tax=Ceratodon purpureus TaxID=3225 RepID=A0A8T0HLW1_CERPU|nr:hypothetical protein KC19_VG043200 [Ceratodon purpureus]
MALLEIHFPLAFWNVMPHLVLHLPRELYWCGPVHDRWMYCAERYIGHLKSLVRNKARPEGSIAMGYIMEEALGFVTEHFRLYPVRARVIWEMEDDERESGEVLEDKGLKRRWPEEELIQLHEHIINHSIITESLYREYLVELDSSDVRARRTFPKFHQWLEDRVLAMLAADVSVNVSVVTMSCMPNPSIQHYASMYAYGQHSRVDDESGRSHVHLIRVWHVLLTKHVDHHGQIETPLKPRSNTSALSKTYSWWSMAIFITTS